MARWLVGSAARFMGVVCGLVLAGSASAAVFPASAGSLELSSHVEYMADPSGALTIEEVRHGDFPGRFRSWSGAGAFNQGYANTVYWLRFPVAVAADGPPRLLLEVRYFSLESLALFTPNGERIRGGLERSATPQIWPHRFPTFRIQPDTEPEYYYLRLSSRGSLTLPLTLWTPEAFAAKTERGYLLLGLYFGGLLALALFNFLLFLSLRDQRYLLYVLYAGFFGVGLLALEGVGNQFLWPASPRLSTLASNGAFSLAAVFAVLFAQRFLDSRHFTPRLNRLLTLVAVIFAGNALIALSGVGIQFSSRLLSLGVPVASVGILITASLAYRRGSRGARFFLLAWGILLVSSIVGGLRNLGWVATTPLTSNILPLGSAGEMILLALALADRIHVERADRAAAQEEALAAKQQLVANLADSERRLEQKVAERTAEAEASRQHLQSILENSPVGIAFLDGSRRIRQVNQAFLDLFPYREEQVLDAIPDGLYASRAEYERIGREAYPILRDGGTYDTVAQMRGADGQAFPAALHGRALNADDLSEGFIWILQDISEQKRLEAELIHEASHDRLTGVYNRKHFEEILDAEIERAQRYSHSFSLVMFDIDHFKAFNDTYGHAIGDIVLKRTAERAHAELRATDSLARWGGEEFMVMLPETPIGNAERLAERLRKAVLVADEDSRSAVSISLAVTEYEMGEAADTTLRRLDDGLYRAKAEGRNRVIRNGPSG